MFRKYVLLRFFILFCALQATVVASAYSQTSDDQEAMVAEGKDFLQELQDAVEKDPEAKKALDNLISDAAAQARKAAADPCTAIIVKKEMLSEAEFNQCFSPKTPFELGRFDKMICSRPTSRAARCRHDRDGDGEFETFYSVPSGTIENAIGYTGKKIFEEPNTVAKKIGSFWFYFTRVGKNNWMLAARAKDDDFDGYPDTLTYQDEKGVIHEQQTRYPWEYLVQNRRPREDKEIKEMAINPFAPFQRYLGLSNKTLPVEGQFIEHTLGQIGKNWLRYASPMTDTTFEGIGDEDKLVQRAKISLAAEMAEIKRYEQILQAEAQVFETQPEEASRIKKELFLLGVLRSDLREISEELMIKADSMQLLKEGAMLADAAFAVITFTGFGKILSLALSTSYKSLGTKVFFSALTTFGASNLVSAAKNNWDWHKVYEEWKDPSGNLIADNIISSACVPFLWSLGEKVVVNGALQPRKTAQILMGILVMGASLDYIKVHSLRSLGVGSEYFLHTKIGNEKATLDPMSTVLSTVYLGPISQKWYPMIGPFIEKQPWLFGRMLYLGNSVLVNAGWLGLRVGSERLGIQGLVEQVFPSPSTLTDSSSVALRQYVQAVQKVSTEMRTASEK